MPAGTGSWWVVPEGLLGDIVNAIAHPGLTRVHWHVQQSPTKPNAQAEGPYSNQLEAQHAANQLNAGQNPLAATTDVSNLTGTQNIGDFFHRLTEPAVDGSSTSLWPGRICRLSERLPRAVAMNNFIVAHHVAGFQIRRFDRHSFVSPP
jgi:hypothetical protein